MSETGNTDLMNCSHFGLKNSCRKCLTKHRTKILLFNYYRRKGQQINYDEMDTLNDLNDNDAKTVKRIKENINTCTELAETINESDTLNDLNDTNDATMVKRMKRTINSSNKLVEATNESDAIDTDIDTNQLNDSIELIVTDDLSQDPDREVAQSNATDNEMEMNMPGINYSDSSNIHINNMETEATFESNIINTNNIDSSNYCKNCKRQQTISDNNDVHYKTIYDLYITECIIPKSSLRRKFSNLSITVNEAEFKILPNKMIQISLCPQCCFYFTIEKPNTKKIYKYIWPSLFWKILSSFELYKIYGTNLWRIIPLQWRQWWYISVRTLLPPEWYYQELINNMTCAVVDVTIAKQSLECSIKKGNLGQIIENCDKYLLPLIKCPWGCTEYFHICGKIPIQTILWRYISEHGMSNLMSPTKVNQAKTVTIGSRNDYLLLNDKNELDYFLYNPSWRIAPSIYFDDMCPVFLTCRNHNKGCKKWYLHPPKNPFGTLPAKSTDQISPAVVVPRTIRMTKAHKYSHAYNMEEMRCHFNGVDTLSVTDKPVFSTDSLLSQLYESLPIKIRTDIQSYISTLESSSNHLANNITTSLQNRAHDIVKNAPDLQNNFDTATTFVTTKDAITLQQQIKKGSRLTIGVTKKNGSKTYIHYTPKWPISMYYIHVADMYGASLPFIPKPSKKHINDTRLLWLLIAMHVCVPEIWNETANTIETDTNEWNGWLLLYMTELCFPHLLKRNIHQTIFSWKNNKTKYDKEIKILEELKIIVKRNENEISNNVENTTNFNLINSENNNISNLNEHNNNDVYDITSYYEESNETLYDNMSLSDIMNNDSSNNMELDSSDVSDISGVFSENIDENQQNTLPNINPYLFDEEQNFRLSTTDNININNISDEINTLPRIILVNYNENEQNNNRNQTISDNEHIINVQQTEPLNERNNEIFYLNKDTEIFTKHKKIMIVQKSELWRNEIGNKDINILIFTKKRFSNLISNNDQFKYSFLPNDLITNTNWELRFISFTIDFLNKIKNKWNYKIFCRHGNDMFMKWWKLTSKNGFVEKVNEEFDVLGIHENYNEYCNLAIFVRKDTTESTIYRDTFLNTIGGQSKFICKKHNLPLVAVAKESRNKCCYNLISNTNDTDPCKRKCIFINCPINFCSSSICAFHYKNTKLQYPIKVPSYKNTTNSTNDVAPMNPSNKFDEDQYVLESHFPCESDTDSCASESTYNDLMENIANMDNVYQHVDMSPDDGIEGGKNEDNEENENDILMDNTHNINPMICSSAGAAGGIYLNEDSKQLFVGAHIILNNCGTLLARRGIKLKGNKLQQRFLQSIVATNHGKSVSLLYPEALLFPSIFWNENAIDSSPYGAIPSCLLAHDSTLSNCGFASLIDHFRTRITNTSLLTSTNNKYIAFCFDKFLNLQTRNTHTRIILNRGLWNCGLGKSVPEKDEPLFDVDSIESRPIVNKLAAAVAEEQATYFYTHTCNQQDHFGIRQIKRWIDSNDLETIILEKFKNIPGLTKNISRYIEELKISIIQSAAVSMLRNWMEVSIIWMNYIRYSEEKPLGKVKNIWWRHEYQDTKGNLSHIHALIWVDKSENQSITLNRIRGSTIDLISNHEIDKLVEEKILHNTSDIYTVRLMAEKLLKHICNERCKRRTGVGVNDLKCRVTNNGVENPDPKQHSFKEYDVQYTQTCINILNELGLMRYDQSTKKYEVVDELKAIKHFPPAIAAEGNISACNGRLFAACLSNDNLKFVTSYLASRYLTKYVATIDKNNRIYFSSNPTDASEIKAKMEFLHNTKITSSEINERTKYDLSRNKTKPQGRAISLMEIIGILLGYPQVYTDLKFIHVPTIPLAERCAVEKDAFINKITKMRPDTNIDDFDSGHIVSQFYLRNIALTNKLPVWRQYSTSESLLMKDEMFNTLSTDNVTAFGLRPPELRFVRHIKLYYKWFYFKKSDIMQKTFSQQVSILETIITEDIIKTQWVDGSGRCIYIRPIAINEILEYIQTRQCQDFYGNEQYNINLPCISSEIATVKETIFNVFYLLKTYIESSIEHNQILENHADITKRFLNVTDIKNLKCLLAEQFPIIWFSSIKPSQGTRWLLHLLISMGEFDNEYNLYCQQNLTKCFIKCKLLSINYSQHDNDYKNLLKRYILEQLNYIPGGSKQFDRNVIAAYQTVRNHLILDIPISTNIPPVLYTQIQNTIGEDCIEYLKTMRKTLIKTTFQKIIGKSTIQLPSCEDLLKSSKTIHVKWNILNSISCGSTQTVESYKEQINVIKYACTCLDSFMSVSSIRLKNLIICGGPGVGKTTLLQILILYAASLGLNVNLSAIMSERSSELGGLHLSKMFCIPTTNHKNPTWIAEKAVFTLLRQPKQFTLLQKLEVLAIDELGQVSAELLSIIDIILRTVRQNSSFMGGIYIISTMDNMQLPPVNGRPPLLSPHMISSFSFQMLVQSVRASQDLILQELQNLTRISYNELTSSNISRFRHLIENFCTHVDSFDDPLLTGEKLRLFGKRSAKELAEESLLETKRHEFSKICIECKSVDFESTLESQWNYASTPTTALLNHMVKEPGQICFYPFATFEITFNSPQKFSQGQLAILHKMPTLKQVQDFEPISIYVAPNGCKTFPTTINHESLLQQGWKIRKMTKCKEHTVLLHNGLQAKRRQYGLRHRIASTIHAGMGQDLQYVVTKVTDKGGDPNYHLWHKEQVIVLLSRTNFAKDIIFVGNKEETSKALSTLLQKRSQYTEYTNAMLSALVTENENTHKIQTLSLNMYPYRILDFIIPVDSCGYVYLLLSLNPYMSHSTYIGETTNLNRRLNEHNQLRGSNSTSNPLLLPWALVCFVTGFTSISRSIRKQFEQSWKIERDKLKLYYKRTLSIKEICNVAKHIIQRYNNKELRLVQCLSFDEDN